MKKIQKITKKIHKKITKKITKKIMKTILILARIKLNLLMQDNIKDMNVIDVIKNLTIKKRYSEYITRKKSMLNT